MMGGQKMTIDFSIEEYFEQLQLMEQQYGFEEDLYPWIYMILQMAECKKREQLKENYKELSIRDVHSAKSSISFNASKKDKLYWKMRFDLIKKVGAPDFVIAKKDKNLTNDEKYIGCVEVKNINTKLFDEERELTGEIGIPDEFCHILGYHRTPIESVAEENREKLEKKIKELKGNDIFIKKYKSGNNFVVSCENEEKLEKAILEICECVPTLKVKTQGKGVWKYNTKDLPARGESDQLAGHLDKYKKVLFTNGLEFYYLEKGKVSENKYEYSCCKIANLAQEYKKYKESKETNKEFDGTEANNQWEKLKKALKIINWYEAENIESLKNFIEKNTTNEG